MQKYFRIDGVTELKTLPAGSSIHIIGVCGVAMAALALELVARGFKVSGSDKDFFEPMGSALKHSSVKLYQGYRGENIPSDSRLVIIGNAVSRDHPEVLETEARKLAYSCFPSLLADLILKDRHSIVVAGTHGKSTTTALAGHVLRKLGSDSSMFVGAQPIGQASGLRIGAGKFSIVEGDEYDSAFFAKVPKFSFYQPRSTIITSIEFDHADIYRDLAQIEEQFAMLVKLLPKDGRAVCCIDCENIRRLLPLWRQASAAPIMTYGISADADLRMLGTVTRSGGQEVVTNQGRFFLPLSGEHNALNSVAVFGVLKGIGFDATLLQGAFADYPGIKRRQEIRYKGQGITVIDDFAHHPTAVRETLRGLRAMHPAARIWAVFEPRSNTSRRKVFQAEYATAFREADLILFPNIKAREIDAGLELLQVEELAATVRKSEKNARMLANADEICELLLKECAPNDLIVVMSNGGFDGLVEKLVSALEKRK